MLFFPSSSGILTCFGCNLLVYETKWTTATTTKICFKLRSRISISIRCCMCQQRYAQLIGIEEVLRNIFFIICTKFQKPISIGSSAALKYSIDRFLANRIAFCLVPILETFIFVFQRLSHVFVFRLCSTDRIYQSRTTAHWIQNNQKRQKTPSGNRLKPKLESVAIGLLNHFFYYLFRFICNWEQNQLVHKEQTKQTNWFCVCVAFFSLLFNISRCVFTSNRTCSSTFFPLTFFNIQSKP